MLGSCLRYLLLLTLTYGVGSDRVTDADLARDEEGLS